MDESITQATRVDLDASGTDTVFSGAGGEMVDEEACMGDPGPRPGDTLGRYVLVERIGQGGMGVVYRAFDPELTRLVALKYVRRGAASTQPGEAEVRLAREARAIAQVSHPNVVQIFDVGQAAQTGRVFIAMELIDGPTLRGWLDAPGTPRTPAAVLELFLRVGRGLAAAHERDIVHRDFKPENVLIDGRGVPKVVDFGLATLGSAPAAVTTASESQAALLPAASLHDGLTRAGARLGTPAYMAPEQWSGGEVTPRCDQFSFAVALWEALYAELPFEGPTVDAYAFHVLEGKLREPPRRGEVPRHLPSVLRKALAIAPEDRFEDMASLLDALALDPRRRARTVAGLGLATFAAIGLATGGYVLAQRGEASEQRACLAALETRSAHWDDGARRALTEALTRTGRPFAPQVARRAIDDLDRGLDLWRERTGAACRAGRPIGLPEQAELEAARELCLDRGLDRHRALVARMAELEPQELEFVPQATASVRASVEACDDPTRLRTAWQTAREARSHPALAQGLEQIAVDLALGRATAVRHGLEALPEPPPGERWPPALYAELVHSRVGLELLAGDPAEALRELDDAFAELAGAPLSDELRLTLQARLGEARYAAGDFEGMRAAYRRHYEMSRAVLGDDDIDTALAYGMQGHYHYATGAYARALEYYEGGLARATLRAPDRAPTRLLRQWVAETRLAAGDGPGAHEALTTLLASTIAELGPDHPDTLDLAFTLGRAELVTGDASAARERFDELLRRRRADPGWVGTRDEVALLGNLGAALLRADDPEAALRHLDEASEQLAGVGSDGSDDPLALALDANRGTALLDLGRGEAARDAFERAARRSHELGEQNTHNGLTIRRQLALAQLRTGDRRAAGQTLDRLEDALRGRELPQIEAEVATVRAALNAADPGSPGARADAH